MYRLWAWRVARRGHFSGVTPCCLMVSNCCRLLQNDDIAEGSLHKQHLNSWFCWGKPRIPRFPNLVALTSDLFNPTSAELFYPPPPAPPSSQDKDTPQLVNLSDDASLTGTPRARKGCGPVFFVPERLKLAGSISREWKTE